MNKLLSGSLSAFIIITFFFMTSCEKDKSLDKSSVNEWIHKTMKRNYLWNDELPDSYSQSNKSEEDYFYSLLSGKDGKHDQYHDYYYSYIEEEIPTKSGSIKTTYGFNPGFHLISANIRDVYMRIQYVIPGSPAEAAGLKRGDWVSHYNGIRISESNYKDFQKETSAMTLAVGVMGSNGFTKTHDVSIGAAVSMAESPVFIDTTYLVNNKKIAYLMYNSFVSGPEGNDDKTYNNELKRVFTKFAGNSPDAFVLDLRYNLGGLLTCAQLLATMLAPQSALDKIFCQLAFNKALNKTEDYTFDRNLLQGGANLDLKKLYILTGVYTASSSELIINGLSPYMDVVLIGNQTEGKNVGSNEFSDKPNHSWVLHPITCSVKNSEGLSDYAEGFIPDYDINEIWDTNALGDTNEMLLKSAISIIETGNAPSGLRAAAGDDFVTLGKSTKPVIIR